MLREEAQMKMVFNITVSAAEWALLAGYLVVPAHSPRCEFLEFISLSEPHAIELEHSCSRD
jgi:hypothetical protein